MLLPHGIQKKSVNKANLISRNTCTQSMYGVYWPEYNASSWLFLGGNLINVSEEVHVVGRNQNESIGVIVMLH